MNPNTDNNWILLSVILALLFLPLVKCGKKNQNTETGSEEAAGDNAGSTSKTLAEWVSTLETERPGWEEVDRLAANVSKLQNPPFARKVNASSEKFGQSSGLVKKHLAYWRDLHTGYGANISSAIISSMPPWIDSSGNNLTYPLTSQWLDEKLRGYSIGVLLEKEKGLPVWMINFYPPGMIDMGHTTEADFRAWIASDFTTEIKAVAAAAERLKMEYFGPFPIELEVFLENQQGFISGLNNTEKASLGQYFADTVLAASSAFTGTLVAHIHHNYDNGPNPYASVSYTGYDILAFSFFPACDQTSADTYIDNQLSEYLKIADASGLPWMVGEVGIFEIYFTACGNGGETLKTMEPNLYTSFFTKVDAASPAPVGVFVDDDMRVQASIDIVKAYFAGK